MFLGINNETVLYIYFTVTFIVLTVEDIIPQNLNEILQQILYLCLDKDDIITVHSAGEIHEQ